MKPPTALNTDAQWAQAIAWLQSRGLRLHVPLRGEVWFEKIIPVRVAPATTEMVNANPSLPPSPDGTPHEPPAERGP